MKKIEKFEYGYVNNRKKSLTFRVILMIALGLIVFLIGLMLNKFQYANIFTILAVLFVLPMARYLTILLVIIGFKSPDKGEYESVKQELSGHGVLLFDIVFSSTETTMCVDYMVLNGSIAYIYSNALSDKQKDKFAKAEKFLNTHFSEKGYTMKTKSFTDLSAFIKAASARTPDAEELEQLLKIKESMSYFII